MKDLEKTELKYIRELCNVVEEALETRSGRIMLYTELQSKGTIDKEYDDCSDRDLRLSYVKMVANEADDDYEELLEKFNFVSYREPD